MKSYNVRHIFMICVCLLFVTKALHAQNKDDERDTSYVRSMIRQADRLFLQNKKDSSLWLYKKCDRACDSLALKHDHDAVTVQWIRSSQITATYNIATLDYNSGKSEQAEKTLKKARNLAETYKMNNMLVSIFTLQGNLYKSLNKNDKAIQEFEQALLLANKIGDKDGALKALNALAIIHRDLGKIQQAIDFSYRSIQIAEESKAIRSIPNLYSLLGALQLQQNDMKMAEECFKKGLQQGILNKDKKSISVARNNLGSYYQKTKQFALAIQEFEEARNNFKELKEEKNLAITLINLGHVQTEMKDYKAARLNCEEGLSLSQKLKDSRTEAASYRNLGTIDYYEGKYAEAEQHLNSAIQIAKKINYALEIKEASEYLYKTQKALNQNKAAFETFKVYIKMRDSIQNEENTKNLIRQQFRFEYDKKEALAKADFEKQNALRATETEKRKLILANEEQKLKLLSNESSLQELKIRQSKNLLAQKQAENEAQQNNILVLNSEQELQQKLKKQKEDEIKQEKRTLTLLASGSLIIVVILIFVIRAFLNLRKSNRIIRIQDNELKDQKKTLEEKQKELLDSIHYAKRIQRSLLPTAFYISKNLKSLKSES